MRSRLAAILVAGRGGALVDIAKRWASPRRRFAGPCPRSLIGSEPSATSWSRTACRCGSLPCPRRPAIPRRRPRAGPADLTRVHLQVRGGRSRRELRGGDQFHHGRPPWGRDGRRQLAYREPHDGILGDGSEGRGAGRRTAIRPRFRDGVSSRRRRHVRRDHRLSRAPRGDPTGAGPRARRRGVPPGADGGVKRPRELGPG